MRALLRTLLAVIGVLGLVVVGAVVYVTTFFDPNDLKPRLIEVVRQQTGLELSLEGPLSWSFYPRLGVSVADAEAWLPDQTMVEEEPFVAFQKAEVSLAFAPLLRGEIAIDGLTLDGMRLNLERDEEGRDNWSVLLERLNERSEETADALAPASAGPGLRSGDAGMSVALDIASVQVRESQVRFRDWQEELQLQVAALNISGTNVNPQRAFPLRASFRLSTYNQIPWQEDDEATPDMVSSVTLESRVRLGLEDGRYVFDNLVVDTTTTLTEYEERRQQINLRAQHVVAEPEVERYLVEGGRLESSLSHPALGERALALSLAFMADADLAEEQLRLRNLELTGPDGLALTGSLSASQLFSNLQYAGQVSLAPLSLRPWLARFDLLPNTASDAAFSDVALTSPLQGNLSQLALSNLTLVLDDTTFTGPLRVGLTGDELSFNLQGDHLDLDRYLPVDQTSAGSAMLNRLVGIESAYADEEDETFALDWLAPLELDGELSLDRLQLNGLDLQSVYLVAQGSEGHHRLETFEARLYDGRLALTGELNLREEPARWAFAPRLERVQIVPFYEALGDGDPSPLRGRLNLDGELTARGDSVDLMTRTLNGRLAARIDDGAVLDVNVSQELCSAVALLEGEETSREWSADTRFDSAQATFLINDGVARNDDLDISIPGISLSGEGEVNLATRRFDYGAAARFVDTADAACRVNPRLERVLLPVRCEGSLEEESGEWCRFDQQAFQRAIAELIREEASQRAAGEIQERLGGALEQLDERLGEGASRELRDTLRGLLN
ncbi:MULTISPECIES: AsmA family protein [Halomonadaceae]|uniref:AsmA family protein n=1 Tax=Halomonadaceae TaxID=28256 RepID=UPI001597F1A7|nr:MULTISPECIES: AsmA family protein [Halomonas]QJQ94978.1 AsmA family protein [Halomonas sp. PA5]